MKQLIAAIALIAPLYAHAWQLELGSGVTRYQAEDGRWWQQDVDHTLKTQSPMLSLGVTGDVGSSGVNGVAWHADYVYMGRAAASCICVSDSNYDPIAHKVLRDADKGSFTGSGHTSGVVLSLEPHVWRFGFRWAAEAGVFAHRDTWSDNVITPTFQVQVRSEPTIHFAPVVGASIGSGNWSLRYRHYFTGLNSRQMNVPPLWNDIDTLEYVVRF